MSFTEKWWHESGLEISAFDSEKVELSIMPGPVDEIVNDSDRKPTDFIGNAAIGFPRETFERFVVSQEGKVLFRSSETRGRETYSAR